MLHKSSSKITIESSPHAISAQAILLHINASAASGLTYSPEDASGFIKTLFKGLKENFPKSFKQHSSKKVDMKQMDSLAAKIQTKSLGKVGETPVSIQDGLQVDLKTWIATLHECYSSLGSELTEAIEGLKKLFAVLINDPDKIKSLSDYGSVEKSMLDDINVKFQSMFGQSNRSSRATIFDMVSTVSDIATAREDYGKLLESRVRLDINQVSKDIDRINELADTFLEKYSLRLATNRRAVSDLSLHVHAIAEGVTLLSLLDYSFSVLEKTITDITKKI